MANLQKGVAAIELTNDSNQALCDKALGYPKSGAHLGGGRHVNMPAGWNAQGATPPGWTKHASDNLYNSALDTFLFISDAIASQIQAGYDNLTALEQTSMTALLATRATQDIELKIYLAKP